MPPPTTLITTVHDPERRLLPRLLAHANQLSAYSASYAFVTDVTDKEVVTALRGAGVDVVVGPSGSAGRGQRSVLRRAAEDRHDDIFCCDLDRWLHWANSFPMELTRLPDIMATVHPHAWYTCLGRSPRAFATHPAAQQHPEAVTNRALSSVAGRSLDATAGASWIRLPAAELILQGSSCTTKATDLEWPGLVLRSEPDRVTGAVVEGLEFETSGYHADAIAAAGSLDAWLRDTYDRPEVLRGRLLLAAESIDALMRVMNRR